MKTKLYTLHRTIFALIGASVILAALLAISLAGGDTIASILGLVAIIVAVYMIRFHYYSLYFASIALVLNILFSSISFFRSGVFDFGTLSQILLFLYIYSVRDQLNRPNKTSDKDNESVSSLEYATRFNQSNNRRDNSNIR